LSFANIDDPDFEKSLTIGDEVEMGDIIIALETLQREAQEKKISLYDHFCHLLTHGVLHLLGYDHIEDDEAEHMEAFEIEILNLLNISNPYQE
jgi:probable rRNA maturation factor